MDRRSLDALARFCAQQQEAFDAHAWWREGASARRAYAVAAKYLSMTSWYGHDEELERVAVQLSPALAFKREFECELRSLSFDLQYFSFSLRFLIAQRNAKYASRIGEVLAAQAQAAPLDVASAEDPLR